MHVILSETILRRAIHTETLPMNAFILNNPPSRSAYAAIDGGKQSDARTLCGSNSNADPAYNVYYTLPSGTLRCLISRSQIQKPPRIWSECDMRNSKYGESFPLKTICTIDMNHTPNPL